MLKKDKLKNFRLDRIAHENNSAKFSISFLVKNIEETMRKPISTLSIVIVLLFSFPVVGLSKVVIVPEVLLLLTANKDCNGDWGGTAIIDNCSSCVGGNTGQTACTLPTIQTVAATNITETTGNSGGTSISDGGADITSKGVCYSTSPLPVSPCTNEGEGTGAFASTMHGLNFGTKYYYRAYATNSQGTTFGADNSFTTNIPVSCKRILEISSSSDGIYQIDPDGNGDLEPFNVTCDMTTESGGWTQIPYSSDLPFRSQFSGGGDIGRWLTTDFSLGLTDSQINAIRANATEGKQRYVGLCDGAVHYFYGGGHYNWAFGFRFHEGGTTNFGNSSYSPYSVSVITDGCLANGGEGGTLDNATIFDFRTTEVPLTNVYSTDNGDPSDLFGSPLTSNPAWLR